MSDAQTYDPERHDNQIVAAFETVEIAATARDALVDKGVDRTAIHVIAREAEPVASEPVGDQIMNAFMSLFSSHEDHTDYQQAVHHGHALLAVTIATGVDRHQVIETLEQNGAIDFEAQRAAWSGTAPTPTTDRRAGQREEGVGSNRVRSYLADRT